MFASENTIEVQGYAFAGWRVHDWLVLSKVGATAAIWGASVYWLGRGGSATTTRG